MLGWLVAAYALLVAAAVVGSWFAWTLWRRHRLPFLRAYALYIALCFAHALLNFVGEGFVPMAVGQSPDARARVYALVDLGTIPLLAGIFLTLLLWMRDLLGRTLSRAATWLFAGVEVVFLSGWLATVIAVFESDGTGGTAPPATVAAAVAGTLVLDSILLFVAVSTVLTLLCVRPGAPEPYRSRIARRLGILYAASFAVVAFFLLGPRLPFGAGNPIGLAFLPTLVFLLNVPALVYLHRALGGAPTGRPVVPATDEAVLERLAKSAGITGRELEVVRLVAMGLDNRGIGEKLFISPKTVKNHIGSIYAKTGARNRVQLANLLRRDVDADERR